MTTTKIYGLVLAGSILATLMASGCAKPVAEKGITYIQDCHQVTALGSSVKRSIVITGVYSTTTETYYMGTTDCTGVDTARLVAVSTNDLTGQLPVGENPNAVAVLKNDFVAISTTWTPDTATATAYLNNPLCTGVTFSTGVVTSIAGKSCSGSQIAADGELTYAVSRYDANNLYFHDLSGRTTTAGVSVATRLKALETYNGNLAPYVLQP